MSQKATFTSKLGVIAATVGSAVGLGTVWRFPNEVQSNGGSVFLITYLLCVLLVGIPVMLAEFSVGRGSGSDAIGAYRKLTPRRPWWIVGVISVLAPYLIMMYYMVVAGWTLQYLWMSLSGALFEGVGSGAAEPEAFQAIMRHSLAEGWQPVFWTAVMIVVNLLVLMRGVQKGIERMANTLMPLLFVILLVFCVVSLNLPDAIDGVEYFLRPDWSKLDGGVLISAVGQAFFSLSLGMGILVTYSSFSQVDQLAAHGYYGVYACVYGGSVDGTHHFPRCEIVRHRRLDAGHNVDFCHAAADFYGTPVAAVVGCVVLRTACRGGADIYGVNSGSADSLFDADIPHVAA